MPNNNEVGSVPQRASSAVSDIPAYSASGNQSVYRGKRGGYGGSGVCWTAILAGAAAAAALSLILLILGMGLGFSVVSPWSSSGAGPVAISIAAAIWLALTQIIASGLGGYLAGRLRSRWWDVHADEVYFRDTAHGMLSWAVASLAMAVLAGSVLAGMAGMGSRVAAGAASSAIALGQSAVENGVSKDDGRAFSYFTDSLFRSDKAGAENQGRTFAKDEAVGIFVHSLGAGGIDEQDKEYLARLVAQRTGLSQADAERRVDDLYSQVQQDVEQAKVKAKELADATRKAIAGTALWAFIALLCGAFVASLAALWGGRRRDLAEPEALGAAPLDNV